MVKLVKHRETVKLLNYREMRKLEAVINQYTELGYSLVGPVTAFNDGLGPVYIATMVKQGDN